MRSRVEYFVKARVAASIAACFVRPCEATANDVVLKMALGIPICCEGIEVACNHCRRIFSAETTPFFEQHLRNLGVGALLPRFIVLVWQVGVEMPENSTTELVLCVGDTPRCMVVARNGHLATNMLERDLARIVIHGVAAGASNILEATGFALQQISILGFLGAKNRWAQADNGISKLSHFPIAPSTTREICVQRIVAHDFQYLSLVNTWWRRRCWWWRRASFIAVIHII